MTRRKLLMLLTQTVIALPYLGAISAVQAEDTQSLEVEKLVAGLQARYGRLKSMSADFTQVYRDKAGRKLTENGFLILKRPGKMRWEYLQPEKKLFVVDGKQVYFYVPGERQVTITPIKELDDPRLPFIFLLGHRDLHKDFKLITISKTESPLKAGNTVIEMTPKKVSDSLKMLYVEVDPKRLELSRLVLINGNDARSDFLLTNFQDNFVAADEQFTFVPPPGVKVLN